jgi:hypothetical protein
MNRQRGVTLSGLLIGAVILIFVALLGMKIAPAYIEYGQIKKAVAAIAGAEGRTGTVSDIQKAFGRRAQIDDITVITGQDLDITKDRGQVVISFAYAKKIPLFSNVSLLIDFAGSSGSP